LLVTQQPLAPRLNTEASMGETLSWHVLTGNSRCRLQKSEIWSLPCYSIESKLLNRAMINNSRYSASLQLYDTIRYDRRD